MPDERLTRRRLLAATAAGLAGIAGCSSLGGAGPQGVSFPGDSTPAAEDAPTAAGGASETTDPPSESERPVSTEESPASTDEVETEMTPAIAPPDDFVTVTDTGVETRNESVAVTVTLENVGNVVFSRVELRVDLYYTPLGEPRRHVGFTYAERIFEDGFGSGDAVTLSPEPFVTPLDGRVTARTPTKRFDVGVVFRRVCTRDQHRCFLPSQA